MNVTLDDQHGQPLVVGVAGQPLLQHAENVTDLIATCFEHGAQAVLLRPENLPARFWELASGEAGTILQKLRNYNIRLAIVRAPGLQLSQRFEELLRDELRGAYFRMFDTDAAARDWLRAI